MYILSQRLSFWKDLKYYITFSTWNINKVRSERVIKDIVYYLSFSGLEQHKYKFELSLAGDRTDGNATITIHKQGTALTISCGADGGADTHRRYSWSQPVSCLTI